MSDSTPPSGNGFKLPPPNRPQRPQFPGSIPQKLPSRPPIDIAKVPAQDPNVPQQPQPNFDQLHQVHPETAPQYTYQNDPQLQQHPGLQQPFNNGTPPQTYSQQPSQQYNPQQQQYAPQQFNGAQQQYTPQPYGNGGGVPQQPYTQGTNPGGKPKSKVWLWVTIIAAAVVLLLVCAAVFFIPNVMKIFSPEEKAAPVETKSVLHLDTPEGGSVDYSVNVDNPFQFGEVEKVGTTGQIATSKYFPLENGDNCITSVAIGVDQPGDNAEDVKTKFINSTLAETGSDRDAETAPHSEVTLPDLNGKDVPTTLYSHTIVAGDKKLPAITFITQTAASEKSLASISIACNTDAGIQEIANNVVNGVAPYNMLVTIK